MSKVETDLRQQMLETTKTIKIAQVNRAIKGDMTPKSVEIWHKIYEVLETRQKGSPTMNELDKAFKEETLYQDKATKKSSYDSSFICQR